MSVKEIENDPFKPKKKKGGKPSSRIWSSAGGWKFGWLASVSATLEHALQSLFLARIFEGFPVAR
jgi:hypothetical protein